MNQRETKGSKSEHYENFMAIGKVLSLVKASPYDSIEDIAVINITRRTLEKFQTQEYDADIEDFRRSMK